MILRRLVLLLLSAGVSAQYDRGILVLDNTTFDRVIGHGTPAFVRIDKEYSYGEEDDAFREAAVAVGESSAALFFCSVPVSDPPHRYRGEDNYGEYSRHHYRGGYGEGDRYGEGESDGEGDGEEGDGYEEGEAAAGRGLAEEEEDAWRENQDLAARFELDLDELPHFLFFPAGWSRGRPPLIYDGPTTKEGILSFVQEKANAWIGLPGQDEEFHRLAQSFSAAARSDREAILASVEANGALSERPNAAYYKKVMAKLLDDDSFPQKEVARLNKMIESSSLSETKRSQFAQRLNALASFSSAD